MDKFIKYVCRVPLRLTEEEPLVGDDAIHGGVAYHVSDDAAGVVPDQALMTGGQSRNRDIEDCVSRTNHCLVSQPAEELKQDWEKRRDEDIASEACVFLRGLEHLAGRCS